jgi:hypothetical protein
MLATTRSHRPLAWSRIGTGLFMAVGCGAPALNSAAVKGARNAASVDPSLPQAALMTPTDNGASKALTSSVRKVTVYSDRALVTREATDG